MPKSSSTESVDSLGSSSSASSSSQQKSHNTGWLSSLLNSLSLSSSSRRHTPAEKQSNRISPRSTKTRSLEVDRFTALQLPEQEKHTKRSSADYTQQASTEQQQQQSKPRVREMDPAIGQPESKHTARKGVRWDGNVPARAESQMNQVAYSTFATPADWEKRAVAAYPYMNRYKLIAKMGEGAFSIVYRAIDTKTNLLVALKLVAKHQLNETQRTNILRETSLLRRISHPNIIRLVDFHETPLHYALVLELMSGGEIFHQLVSQVCFSEPVCRHIIVQVAEALRYLHEERGVVHRDIKLENLLYEPIPANLKRSRTQHAGDSNIEDDYIPGVGGAGIGLVKVADFGLSKIVFDATTKTPCGTVGYTAPEILRDQRYSKGVDMWALGCVLYTILSGFPPFFDDDPRGLTEKVANGQFAFLSPWWDEISTEAKDLICHLLEVDPKKRYNINQFLAHPWVKGETFASVNSNVPQVQINTEDDNTHQSSTAKSNVKYPDWPALPEVLHTPLEASFEETAPAADTAEGTPDYFPDDEKSSLSPIHLPSPAVPPVEAAQRPAQDIGTPTYRRLRTPHPVPDGITKEMLAAPYQVYQSIAEGETRPEHIGTVRGGVVPNEKGSGYRASAGRRIEQGKSSSRGVKRSGQPPFELDMEHSRLFMKRKGHEAINPRAIHA